MRGNDSGAKAAIYRPMLEFAGQGVALVMMSSDIEEAIGMSDRVCRVSCGQNRARLYGDAKNVSFVKMVVDSLDGWDL